MTPSLRVLVLKVRSVLSLCPLVSSIVHFWFLARRDVLPRQHTLDHLKTVGPFMFTKPSLERRPVIAVVTAEHLVTGVVWVLLDREHYVKSL